MGYSPLGLRWSNETAVALKALGGLVLLAIAFSWPLPVHFGTHLTGPPDGDTGVYVWNQWVFRRELLAGRLPWFTREIFSLSRPANLSLHNYTVFQDLLALPFVPILGSVATFNLVYLATIVITGYAMFRLAWHVTGRPFESWLAGVLFSWSPILVTRGSGHFSLVAAAPLAVFVTLLLRLNTRARWRDALALGATLCWAAIADPYYAVFCLLIAVVFLAATTVNVADDVATEPDSVLRAIDIQLVCVLGLVAALLVSDGWQFSIAGQTVSIHGLYTPMLLLTLGVLARLGWLHRRMTISIDRQRVVLLLRFATTAGLVAVTLLSPVLYAVGVRIRDSGLESSNVFWRSSPGGVDLLSFFLPNPNHPWTPEFVRTWLSPRPDAYFENVASITFVAILVIVAAVRIGWRPSRFWLAMTVVFGLMSLGPFVHVGGLDTHVPGPWALLRYVPIVRLARSPARLTVVLMLVVSVLFAKALARLGDRSPARRRLLRGAATAALLFELLPAPRTLYAARVPAFYQRVAANPNDVRVLELPFGLRDGTLSIGNFTARSQFFQTAHGKRLIGGYVSRVSRRRVSEFRDNEMLNALMTMSEGRDLAQADVETLVAAAPAFIRSANIAFVVIDDVRTPPGLRDFALRALRLERVDGEGALTLYVPRTDPLTPDPAGSRIPDPRSRYPTY